METACKLLLENCKLGIWNTILPIPKEFDETPNEVENRNLKIFEFYKSDDLNKKIKLAKADVIMIVSNSYQIFNEYQWNEFKFEIISEIRNIPESEENYEMLLGILGFRLFVELRYKELNNPVKMRTFLSPVMHDIEGSVNHEKSWYSPKLSKYAYFIEEYDKKYNN